MFDEALDDFMLSAILSAHGGIRTIAYTAVHHVLLNLLRPDTLHETFENPISKYSELGKGTKCLFTKLLSEAALVTFTASFITLIASFMQSKATEEITENRAFATFGRALDLVDQKNKVAQPLWESQAAHTEKQQSHTSSSDDEYAIEGAHRKRRHGDLCNAEKQIFKSSKLQKMPSEDSNCK